MESYKSEDFAAAMEVLSPVVKRPGRRAVERAKDAALDAELASGGELVRKPNVVGEEDAKVMRQVSDIVVQGAIDASSINDDGSSVEGKLDWTPRRMRVAQDQRATARERPGYIDVMTKVYESTKKLDAMRGAPPALNGDIKVFVNGDLTFKYPTKIVEDAED